MLQSCFGDLRMRALACVTMLETICATAYVQRRPPLRHVAENALTYVSGN